MLRVFGCAVLPPGLGQQRSDLRSALHLSAGSKIAPVVSGLLYLAPEFSILHGGWI
jgi:hypothetical protein